jgi:hypothetical protein
VQSRRARPRESVGPVSHSRAFPRRLLVSSGIEPQRRARLQLRDLLDVWRRQREWVDPRGSPSPTALGATHLQRRPGRHARRPAFRRHGMMTQERSSREEGPSHPCDRNRARAHPDSPAGRHRAGSHGALGDGDPPHHPRATRVALIPGGRSPAASRSDHVRPGPGRARGARCPIVFRAGLRRHHARANRTARIVLVLQPLPRLQGDDRGRGTQGLEFARSRRWQISWASCAAALAAIG